MRKTDRQRKYSEITEAKSLLRHNILSIFSTTLTNKIAVENFLPDSVSVCKMRLHETAAALLLEFPIKLSLQPCVYPLGTIPVSVIKIS